VQIAEQQLGPHTLIRAALERGRAGTTSLQEVLRVAGDLETGAAGTTPREASAVEKQ
jgi:hypothetical protein